MTMPRYGLWHPVWDQAWFSDELSEDGDHFIFVEEVALVAPEGLLRPDGEPISRKTVLGNRPWRFRSSGIQVRKFLDAMDRFEPLNHEDITDDQRSLRRRQLVEEFAEAPLPLFDIYVDEENEDLLFLRASLTPGSWYWIGVRRQDDQDGRLPVFVGAPELAPGPYLPGALAFLEAVPPFIEYRLRDIFSLAHVPDAGIDEIGGETAPPPDKPHDNPDDAEWSRRPRKLDFYKGTPSHGLEA